MENLQEKIDTSENFMLNIMGTWGSGKSALTRKLLEDLEETQPNIVTDLDFANGTTYKFKDRIGTMLFYFLPENREQRKIFAKMRRETIQFGNFVESLRHEVRYIREISVLRKVGANSTLIRTDNVCHALVCILRQVSEDKQEIALRYCEELYSLFLKEFPYINTIGLRIGAEESNYRIIHRPLTKDPIVYKAESERVLLIKERIKLIELLYSTLASEENHFYLLDTSGDFEETYAEFLKIVDRMPKILV